MQHEQAEGSSPTFYCRALYDYSSTDPSSLSFHAGDIIEVLTTLASGWWDGLLNGDTRGWFPSTFTTAISRDDAERALHSRQYRPSVSDSEVLASLGPFSPADSTADWLPNDMDYGLAGGKESFNDLANESISPAQSSRQSARRQQNSDYWMPRVEDDGQIYYVNSETGARSRELPSEDLAQTPTSASSRGILSDLRGGFARGKRAGTPEPWVKRMGDAGVYYYENLVDGSVRWTTPSPTSTPRPDAKQHIPAAPRIAAPQRPLSFGDQFSSNLSFMDDRDEVDFDEAEADGFMNRLSVYSDDSDVAPRSPAVTAFSPADDRQPTLSPQQCLEADLRHAQELQSHLVIPSAPTLLQLSDAVVSAIGLVEDAVARKSQASQISNWNDRGESLNPADDETVQMVIAVRNLLYSFTSGPDASGHSDDLESSLPILKPHQRKVAATLSKLLLSLRSLHIQANWPENTETIQTDAQEMRNVIQSFVEELSSQHHAQQAKSLQGVLVSGRGLAGIGLGSLGAGSAGKWSGNGFIDTPNYPTVELDENILPRIQQLQDGITQTLGRLRDAVASGDQDVATAARGALRALTALTEYLASINAATLDVDGQDMQKFSRTESDAYSSSVSQARILVRNLEAALQMVMDDSSTLLTACQTRGDLEGGAQKTAASLTVGVDLACQSMRGMVQARKTQKNFAGTRRLSGASLRMPTMRKSSAPRIDPIPPRIEVPQASGSRHHGPPSTASLTSPSMIVSPETVMDEYDDDMVDMELAFSREARRAPSVPNDFDASAPFYKPPQTGSRESDSPDPHERATSEGFSNHSRTTSQPTTIGSMGLPAKALENGSNGALPLPDDNLDIDFDGDEELASTKSKRKAPKIKQFFGDDAPQYILNQMKESPMYLRPEYAPSDIMIHPDGSVRGGTLPALIEHLTMHDFRDAIFFNSFIMTFKTFASLDEVCELLIKRFHLQPPEGLAHEQLREWREKKQAVVRIRVINTLKSMLSDDDVISREDVDALDRIEQFARQNQNASPPTKQLLTLIDRARRGGESVIKMSAHIPHDPPPAIYPKSKKFKLVDLDPLELARQMTIMESKLFCTIRASECLQRSRESSGNSSDNIKNIIFTSNKIADWVADSILAYDDHRKRAAIIKLFINTAERCRSLQNFSTMAAFVAGLNSPPIRRLKRSWELVSQKQVATFDSVEKTLDSGRSFQNYKATLSKVDPPCVPFLGVYLTTLTFIQDGSPDLLKDSSLINFNKRHKIADVIREIKTFQSKPYNLTPIPAILSYIDQSISSLTMSADDFWNLSLEREPREKVHDEKMQRLLTESGFL
ncbi:ras GEF [Auricularia subglabra TFB-10046 SS5]|nr:ras GEF [Auricularia subglabra TFB-10046 SS5]